MKIVATCSVVAALAVFGYLVAESQMLSYLSSQPEVCINCHTMNTHYATWQHSSHRAEATCVDCHLPHDSFTRKMLAKARDGYHHSKAMTFGTYGANLRISDDAASRIQENCIRCHESLVSQMVENAQRYSRTSSHVRGGRMCWDCHRGVPHGVTRNLSATQQNFVHN
jgi:cytochrome c nitrite reductase small subunit